MNIFNKVRYNKNTGYNEYTLYEYILTKNEENEEFKCFEIEFHKNIFYRLLYELGVIKNKVTRKEDICYRVTEKIIYIPNYALRDYDKESGVVIIDEIPKLSLDML